MHRLAGVSFLVAMTLSATSVTATEDSSGEDGRGERSKGRSIPSVVVTVKNAAPSRGAFQTPVWIGVHDGSFDIYDRDAALGAEGLVPAPAVERLAEDGDTQPISQEFAISQPYSPQGIAFGPTGPLAPGDQSAITLNVDPETDRFLSYASMLIPSNDAFIANGNPKAHKLFSRSGRFIGNDFVVAGSEVLDAGTESNDEVAANTAFLNQTAPDTGIAENGVVALHPGFRQDATFPDGVLNYPVFGTADFLIPTYRAAEFSLRYVDLGRTTRYHARLRTGKEVTGPAIESRGRGFGYAVARNGSVINLRVTFRNLTGPLAAAHLHLGQAGMNGPVVVNLADGICADSVEASITAGDVGGVLSEGEDPLLNLLNEMAAGNIYINLHTAANPGGELRGQLILQ